MWRKLVVVGIVAAAVPLGLSIAVYARSARNSVPVNWRIAGQALTNIEVTDTITGETTPVALVSGVGQGSPGPVQVEGFGTPGPADAPSGLCPAGTDLELRFSDGGFVATLSDLSTMFFTLDQSPDANNALCIDFEGPNLGVADYVMTGGSGRFEGATGKVTGRFTIWDVSGLLAGETGEIVGTIYRP